MSAFVDFGKPHPGNEPSQRGQRHACRRVAFMLPFANAPRKRQTEVQENYYHPRFGNAAAS
jgi:hypothetical protein